MRRLLGGGGEGPPGGLKEGGRLQLEPVSGGPCRLTLLQGGLAFDIYKAVLSLALLEYKVCRHREVRVSSPSLLERRITTDVPWLRYKGDS